MDTDLKISVEKLLGHSIDNAFFSEAEAYARHKLSLMRNRSDEQYDDNYLALLIVDTICEMTISRDTLAPYI